MRQQVVLLGIAHTSQYGKGADQRKADCFPAIMAMLGGGTVDSAAILAQGKKPNEYVTIERGMQSLRKYGIPNRFVKPLRNEELRSSIEAGNPVILLIKYAAIPRDRRGIKTFTGSHFVLAVGYDAAGIFIHDPLRVKGDGFTYFTDTEIERAMSAFTRYENQPYQAIVIERTYPILSPAEAELVTGQLPDTPSNGDHPTVPKSRIVEGVEHDSRIRRILYELGADPDTGHWYSDSLRAIEEFKSQSQ
jgi:hypothetical protein